MTLAGIRMRVVGKDATPMRGRDGTDTSYVVNTVSFGAGESIDAIFTAPPHSGGAGAGRVRPLQPELPAVEQPGARRLRGAADRGAGSTPPERCRRRRSPTNYPAPRRDEHARTAIQVKRSGASRDTLASRSCRPRCWPTPGPASAQQPPPIGIVCTDGQLVGTTRTFTLIDADRVHQPRPTGTSSTCGASRRREALPAPRPGALREPGRDRHRHPEQHPGAEDDVSIIFPGQEDVLANGAPAQPQFDGSGALVSLTHVAARAGGSVTYSFVATRPGTFLYESGTEPQKQVRMGLFGALLVRPTSGADFAYNRADSQFTPGDEFMVLLSEIDPYLKRQAVQEGTALQHEQLPPPVLVRERAWLPRQHRRQRCVLAAEPALRSAGEDPPKAARNPCPG